MTDIEFERLARAAERSEAETLLDALVLQLGPIRLEPNALALAVGGRVERSYIESPAGRITLMARVLPKSRGTL
jgi:hypothetical protein